MNTRILAASIFLCLASTASLAAQTCNMSSAPNVPVISGLDYQHARAALLAAGWQPGHGSQFIGMAGNQAVFHDRGYTELQSCSMDQAASCRFNFNGGGNIVLRITTEGEENPLLDMKATVKRAELDCQS